MLGMLSCPLSGRFGTSAISQETVAGEGQWYFMSDLRKMKAGVDDANAWTKYDAKMNKQLETAYSKGFKQYTMSFKGKQYIVKLLRSIQYGYVAPNQGSQNWSLNFFFLILVQTLLDATRV